MESDSFDQEIEYERLYESLTGSGSDSLAADLHSEQKQLGGGAKLIHLHAVSTLAEQHAISYYCEHDFNTQSYFKNVCKYGGLLHEAMEWGSTFEEIVAVSDEIVARIVGALTSDRRLPKPKRIKVLVNQVGLGGEQAHIIKLADMQHDCVSLLGLTPKKMTGNLITHVEDWLSDAKELMTTLQDLQESVYLNNQVLDLREKLSQLDKKCKEARKQSATRRPR